MGRVTFSAIRRKRAAGGALRRRLLAAVPLAGLVGTALLAGCAHSPAPHASSRPGSAPRQSAPAPSPTAHAAITGPHAGAMDVPTSTTIGIEARDAKTTTVTLTDETGQPVPGTLHADRKAWVPAHQLDWETRYIAKLSAVGADGQAVTSTVTFTTMSQPANLVMVRSWIGDDQVVGVGMPVVLSFSHPVARDRRADVQQRLRVTSDPAQEGAWNWFNDHEVHYRPRTYWKPGTRLHVDARIGGVAFGDGWYGGNHLTIDASVGDKVVMSVDDRTKRMTVSRNGRVLRVLPVSLGKPGMPSSSGNMVVMTRSRAEVFDSSTFGIPVDSRDGYRTKVYWDLRLTWGGEYIHAAPWSVADQGVRDVSHGCVNLSTANAKWLYDLVHVGDPVITRNTGRPLRWGNGWTDWNVSFEEYSHGGA
jgi:lipoprotein-anchoring transpeptidase ErfK/SrfK